MSAFWLTAYVLVWPVVVGAVLIFISRAFFGEWAEARRTGKPMI